MGFVGDTVESIRSMQIRQVLAQIISLGDALCRNLLFFTSDCFSFPEVFGDQISAYDCYLSIDHMEGVDSCDGERGDILFLHMSKDPIRTGEIVVFNIDGREIPIVHRVIKVHERQDTAEVEILTKGDNNFGDDRLLYAHGQLWLQQHHIMGRAVGYLPYVGWVTIIMTEKPFIKYLLIGALGLLVITSKE
nr:unnamed protein product [Digitaria exilis]